jgi:polyisoprenoid-binding protein YceI
MKLRLINSTALLLIFLMLFAAASTTVSAQSYMTEDGYVEFKSSAPLLTFKGISNHLTGLIDLDKNLVDFYVDLTTLDTGINLRNRHMRDSYLETDKYPFAEFTGTITSGFDYESEGEQAVTVQGDFTIHGVTKEMTITGTLKRVTDGLELNASWKVLLEDHNINKPRVVFYELADEQEVTIKGILKIQN